jgi:hypothetical protein
MIAEQGAAAMLKTLPLDPSARCWRRGYPLA